jgi:hypothetical protein
MIVRFLQETRHPGHLLSPMCESGHDFAADDAFSRRCGAIHKLRFALSMVTSPLES